MYSQLVSLFCVYFPILKNEEPKEKIKRRTCLIQALKRSRFQCYSLTL